MPRDPTAGAVRHAIALRRFENDIVGDLTRLFTLAGNGLRDALIRWDPTDVAPRYRDIRLGHLFNGGDEILRQTYADLASLVAARLIGAGEVEVEFALRQLERSIGAVKVDLAVKGVGQRFFRGIVRNDPIQGAVMRDWWATQERATAFAFRRQVQLGLANGETIQQMIQRVRGRFVRPGVYRGGIMQASTQQAGALTRTAVNHIATQAHYEAYRANEDVTQEYQYVATLDARTTAICASLDGRVFRYDDPSAPRPPLHYNCRSTIVPVVNWEGLGLEPPAPGSRASMGGSVPAELNYQRWLRQQPKSVQDDILGPSRANLFRGNRATLRDLVRSDGSRYTLEELKARVA